MLLLLHSLLRVPLDPRSPRRLRLLDPLAPLGLLLPLRKGNRLCRSRLETAVTATGAAGGTRTTGTAAGTATSLTSAAAATTTATRSRAAGNVRGRGLRGAVAAGSTTPVGIATATTAAAGTRGATTIPRRAEGIVLQGGRGRGRLVAAADNSSRAQEVALPPRVSYVTVRSAALMALARRPNRSPCAVSHTVLLKNRGDLPISYHYHNKTRRKIRNEEWHAD